MMKKEADHLPARLAAKKPKEKQKHDVKLDDTAVKKKIEQKKINVERLPELLWESTRTQ